MVPRAHLRGRTAKYSAEKQEAEIRLREQKFSWSQIFEATGVPIGSAREIVKREEKKAAPREEVGLSEKDTEADASLPSAVTGSASLREGEDA